MDPAPSSGLKAYYLYRNGVFLKQVAASGGSTFSTTDIRLTPSTAYTYGKASWSAEGKAVEGRYVRVWRRDGKAWKITTDVITPN